MYLEPFFGSSSLARPSNLGRNLEMFLTLYLIICFRYFTKQNNYWNLNLSQFWNQQLFECLVANHNCHYLNQLYNLMEFMYEFQFDETCTSLFRIVECSPTLKNMYILSNVFLCVFHLRFTKVLLGKGLQIIGFNSKLNWFQIPIINHHKRWIFALIILNTPFVNNHFFWAKICQRQHWIISYKIIFKKTKIHTFFKGSVSPQVCLLVIVLMSMYKSAINQVEICLGMFTNIVKLQNWKKPLLMKFSWF
jgi:hypothetical protein